MFAGEDLEKKITYLGRQNISINYRIDVEKKTFKNCFNFAHLVADF